MIRRVCVRAWALSWMSIYIYIYIYWYVRTVYLCSWNVSGIKNCIVRLLEWTTASMFRQITAIMIIVVLIWTTKANAAAYFKSISQATISSLYLKCIDGPYRGRLEASVGCVNVGTACGGIWFVDHGSRGTKFGLCSCPAYFTHIPRLPLHLRLKVFNSKSASKSRIGLWFTNAGEWFTKWLANVV